MRLCDIVMASHADDVNLGDPSRWPNPGGLWPSFGEINVNLKNLGLLNILYGLLNDTIVM